MLRCFYPSRTSKTLRFLAGCRTVKRMKPGDRLTWNPAPQASREQGGKTASIRCAVAFKRNSGISQPRPSRYWREFQCYREFTLLVAHCLLSLEQFRRKRLIRTFHEPGTTKRSKALK